MIPQIKKILFSTDLTENSRHAFPYAVGLAARYGAGLVVLHVMEKLQGGVEERLADFFGQEKWREIRQSRKQEARQILIGKQRDHDIIGQALGDFCRTNGAGETLSSFQPPEILVTEGKIIEEIIKTAKEKECDLIVMGAHKGLFGSTAIGSITKGVLHHSGLPILVAPPPQPEEHFDD
jgi:nucleotide-binding universal stress UspA family protein